MSHFYERQVLKQVNKEKQMKKMVIDKEAQAVYGVGDVHGHVWLRGG